MPPKSLLALLNLAVVFSVVLAKNDWTKPCFDGECAYDLLVSTGTSGTLKLHASPRALTDITPAAGWVILDCDPNTLDQDIRLVCENDNSASGCRHAFEHGGPTNKVVRLPESCGHGPFARVVRANVAQDQSLPAHIEGKVTKRDGLAPKVHTFTIDDNFAAVDPAKYGEVKFAFAGANVPGIDLNKAFVDNIWDDFTGWVSKTTQKVAEVLSDGGKWVIDHIPESHFEIKPTIQATNISITTNPLNWSRPLSIDDCPVGNVGVTLESKGWLEAKAGILIAGSVIPPNIDEIGAFGGLNGEVDAKLQFELMLQGGFTVENKLVNDLGLPGFSIPGVITVGPYLSVDGKVQGHVELNVNVGTHLNYVLEDIQLWYPQKSPADNTGRGIRSRDSTLTLEASASVKAQGFLQGTITPKVNIGVSIARGFATASVYLGADAWIRGTVSAGAVAEASNEKRDPATVDVLYAPPYARSLRRRASAGFGGCFWLDTGLHLFGGGQGELWKWKADKEYTIWDSPAWGIYSKCWTRGLESTNSLISKPELTIAEVNKLSTAPEKCPTSPALDNNPISDKVRGQIFKGSG